MSGFAPDACPGWLQRQHCTTKKNENCKGQKHNKHIQKACSSTQIVAYTIQNGGLVASFGPPYRKKEAFGDTFGPKNRQGVPLSTILSAQGPHNNICGVLWDAKGALWHSFGRPKASKWSSFCPLLRH